MTKEISFVVIVPRVCEYCEDRAKEAFPYSIYDGDGKYWEILCNECFDTLGCSYPQQEPTCEICSQPMEWEDCWNGCDDGYLSLYDEDPLFYDEDDQEVCDICDGKGGWWVCPVAYHHQKLEEPTP